MQSYKQYLYTFVSALMVQSSKHRGQRRPLSPQGYERYIATQRRRRAARRHSQRMNRRSA